MASSVSKRFSASATTSALRTVALPPMGSTMDADWSTRKTKQAGLVRLISAVYGTRTSYIGRMAAVRVPPVGTDRDIVIA
jgi:hypothetical protein